MSKGKYSLTKFWGTVALKDPVVTKHGDFAHGVIGLITVMEAKELAGFDPGKSEANWIARVENERGDESMNILGCQIRAIHQHEPVTTKVLSRSLYTVGEE